MAESQRIHRVAYSHSSASGFHHSHDLTLFKVSHVQIIKLTECRSELCCLGARGLCAGLKNPLEPLQEGLGCPSHCSFYLALHAGCQPDWFLCQALYLQDGDKNCLVARSKCFLKMGDLERSLEDAEASLQSDPTFCKVTAWAGGLDPAIACSSCRLQVVVTSSCYK